jgi:hypothetical protein
MGLSEKTTLLSIEEYPDESCCTIEVTIGLLARMFYLCYTWKCEN